MSEPALKIPDAPAAEPEMIGGSELATYLSGKLCHDFISPAGAISTGFDLMDDPSSADMREHALDMIRASAAKLIQIVEFARVAYGAATTVESFDSISLKPMVEALFEGARASLDWQVPDMTLSKRQARILLNLAQVSLSTLPLGGVLTLEASRADGVFQVKARCVHERVRLKAEVGVGLAGQRLSEGLTGLWVQPYWLWLSVAEAGGQVSVREGEGQISLRAAIPARA